MNIRFVNIKPTKNQQLYKVAFTLAIFTILYNIIEGLISTYFGYIDESLALFGFGADSFVEVISGFGIAHMLLRIQHQSECNTDNFERIALKITGSAFYALVTGLLATGIYNLWIEHIPETTFWGVVISLISIAVMSLLIYGKQKVGKLLNSDAILADAACTKVCVYMSIVLLASSLIYEITNFAYIDVIGTFGLAYFSFKEGHECFEKAKNNKFCSCNYR